MATFDTYTLKARLYPIIILFFPIIIVGVSYSFQFESFLYFFYSVGVVSALTYLFSQLGRDQGKQKERALWESWGGAPTTQLLRLTNNRIDKFTKARYHKKLQSLCPVETAPNLELEEQSPTSADEIYVAWTKYLLSHTRDVKAFPLLLKENTSYGFRRNLWGLKPHGLILTLVIGIANYLFWAISLGSYNPLSFPVTFEYSTLLLSLILFFWLIVVTRNWIKVTAFSYAERLCEASEQL